MIKLKKRPNWFLKSKKRSSTENEKSGGESAIHSKRPAKKPSGIIKSNENSGWSKYKKPKNKSNKKVDLAKSNVLFNFPVLFH